MALRSNPIFLRDAQSKDLPTLAAIHCKAHENNDLYHYCNPGRKQHPRDEQRQCLLRMRNTYWGNPRVRYVVAADEHDNVVGLATWMVNGNCPLADKWIQSSVSPWPALERALLGLEQLYERYVTDRCTDYGATADLRQAMDRACDGLSASLYCLGLVVDPQWQRRNIGRQLLIWGMWMAQEEALPVVLTASPEGRSLYKKEQYRVFKVEKTAVRDMPVLLWEPHDLKGKYLREDEEGNVHALFL